MANVTRNVYLEHYFVYSGLDTNKASVRVIKQVTKTTHASEMTGRRNGCSGSSPGWGASSGDYGRQAVMVQTSHAAADHARREVKRPEKLEHQSPPAGWVRRQDTMRLFHCGTHIRISAASGAPNASAVKTEMQLYNSSGNRGRCLELSVCRVQWVHRQLRSSEQVQPRQKNKIETSLSTGESIW